MVSILGKLRANFVFTGELHKEADYYRSPLSQSRYFRSGTITLAVALAVGTYGMFRYWPVLSWMSLSSFILALLCAIGLWVRTIADHAKMRRRLENAELSPPTSEELLRESAGGTNLGSSFVYVVAVLLTLGWLDTISRLATLLLNCQAGGK